MPMPRAVLPNWDATVTVLDLKNMGLASLPRSIGTAVNLIKLDVGSNPELTTLPDELARCT